MILFKTIKINYYWEKVDNFAITFLLELSSKSGQKYVKLWNNNITSEKFGFWSFNFIKWKVNNIIFEEWKISISSNVWGCSKIETNMIEFEQENFFIKILNILKFPGTSYGTGLLKFELVKNSKKLKFWRDKFVQFGVWIVDLQYHLQNCQLY